MDLDREVYFQAFVKYQPVATSRPVRLNLGLFLNVCKEIRAAIAKT